MASKFDDEDYNSVREKLEEKSKSKELRARRRRFSLRIGREMGRRHSRKYRDKSDAQRFHAKKRARQRYNCVLNDKEYKEIVIGIQEGEFPCLKRESSTRSHFQVILHNGAEAVAVYDKERGTICTFLPYSKEAYE